MGLKMLNFFITLKGTVSRDDIKHHHYKELTIRETVSLCSLSDPVRWGVKQRSGEQQLESYKNRAVREREKSTQECHYLSLLKPHTQASNCKCHTWVPVSFDPHFVIWTWASHHFTEILFLPMGKIPQKQGSCAHWLETPQVFYYFPLCTHQALVSHAAGVSKQCMYI